MGEGQSNHFHNILAPKDEYRFNLAVEGKLLVHHRTKTRLLHALEIELHNKQKQKLAWPTMADGCNAYPIPQADRIIGEPLIIQY